MASGGFGASFIHMIVRFVVNLRSGIVLVVFKMAGKTRSSSTAEDFTKHLDNYIKNSEPSKNAIVTTVQAAVLPLQEETINLKDELPKLRNELNEVKVKAIRIFGLNEEEGEDCYHKVLNLCENLSEIQVRMWAN